MDMVEHTDTEHLHYHVRIPKVNLLTHTQLKLYYHAADLGYKKAVIDHVANRYDLVTGDAAKNTVPHALKSIEQIHTWRKEHQQKPFVLNQKKGRSEAEHQISQYISTSIKDGLISNLDEVKKELEQLDLRIVKEGYDKGKAFHYITVENDSGKVRLKGDIYSAGFFRYSKEDREESISSNRSFTTRERELRSSGADIKQTLSAERNKRLKFIEGQYGRAREKAYQAQDERSLRFDNGHDKRSSHRHQETNGGITKEYDKHTQGDVRGGTAHSPEDETVKSRTHTDTKQAVDYTKYRGSLSGSGFDDGNMGSNEVLKQQTSNPAGVRRDDTTNQKDTEPLYEESLVQRSRREGQAEDTIQRERSTLDSVFRKYTGVEDDTARRNTYQEPHGDDGDAQKRARSLRRELEDNSRRLRAELQAAYASRARGRAERRRELTQLYKEAYRAKPRDYYAIEKATASRWSSHAVATHIQRFFSKFREKVDYFKSSIDRGNERFFTELKQIIKETVGGMMEQRKEPTKEELRAQKYQEVIDALSKDKPKKEKVDIQKEKPSYSGPSMGM